MRPTGSFLVGAHRAAGQFRQAVPASVEFGLRRIADVPRQGAVGGGLFPLEKAVIELRRGPNEAGKLLGPRVATQLDVGGEALFRGQLAGDGDARQGICDDVEQVLSHIDLVDVQRQLGESFRRKGEGARSIRLDRVKGDVALLAETRQGDGGVAGSLELSAEGVGGRRRATGPGQAQRDQKGKGKQQAHGSNIRVGPRCFNPLTNGTQQATEGFLVPPVNVKVEDQDGKVGGFGQRPDAFDVFLRGDDGLRKLASVIWTLQGGPPFRDMVRGEGLVVGVGEMVKDPAIAAELGFELGRLGNARDGDAPHGPTGIPFRRHRAQTVGAGARVQQRLVRGQVEAVAPKPEVAFGEGGGAAREDDGIGLLDAFRQVPQSTAGQEMVPVDGLGRVHQGNADGGAEFAVLQAIVEEDGIGQTTLCNLLEALQAVFADIDRDAGKFAGDFERFVPEVLRVPSRSTRRNPWVFRP